MEFLKEERKDTVEEEERKKETKNCQEDSPPEQGNSRVLVHSSPSPGLQFLDCLHWCMGPFIDQWVSAHP